MNDDFKNNLKDYLMLGSCIIAIVFLHEYVLLFFLPIILIPLYKYCCINKDDNIMLSIVIWMAYAIYAFPIIYNDIINFSFSDDMVASIVGISVAIIIAVYSFWLVIKPLFARNNNNK